MAATKKTLEEGFANNAIKENAEAQDSRQRLWDSLEQSYGKQREQIGEEYDRAYSQAGNAALSRGMGRSSYLGQTLAGINNQRAKAISNSYSDQAAAYRSGLNTLEQQEKADAQWEKQFAENQRQFNATQDLTRSENEKNRAFQTSEREATQAYNTKEREAAQAYNTQERKDTQAYNTSEREASQKFTTGEREASQAYNTQERKDTQAYNTSEREASQAYNTAERIANQIYNTSEREAGQEFTSAERIANQDWQAGQSEAQRNWQGEQNALDRAAQQKQFDEQMAFNREQFGYEQKTAAQKKAWEYVEKILAQNGDPDDALLEEAGLSRENYNKMKTQVQQTTSKTKDEKATISRGERTTPVVDEDINIWEGLENAGTRRNTIEKTVKKLNK